jgi:hypothetical protein
MTLCDMQSHISQSPAMRVVNVQYCAEHHRLLLLYLPCLAATLQVEAAAQQISRELEQATQQPAAAAADPSAPQHQQQQGSSQSIKLFIGVNKPGASAGGDGSHGTPGRGSRPSSSTGGAANKGSGHSSSSSALQPKKEQQQAGSKASAADKNKQQQQQQGDGNESAGSSLGGAAAAAAADEEEQAEQSLVSVKIVIDNFMPVMSRVSCRYVCPVATSRASQLRAPLRLPDLLLRDRSLLPCAASQSQLLHKAESRFLLWHCSQRAGAAVHQGLPG